MITATQFKTQTYLELRKLEFLELNFNRT